MSESPHPAAAPRGAGAPVSFGDTLAARVEQRRSQLVLGLDPDPGALWPLSRHGNGRAEERPSPAPARTLCGIALAVVGHCRALIDAVAEQCVAVKLQLARFEALGEDGWRAASEASAHARTRGLLVIADGKRGDIDVSARAYASALFGGAQTEHGSLAGLAADAVTVNPLMGSDAIEPFIEAARARGAGVLVLVRTSNPGAADLQDLQLREGGRVWERAAAIVHELGAAGVGEAGLSDVGAVFGATAAQQLARARELMPQAVFLLPGIGTQGGRIEELAAAFSPGPAAALVSASRALSDAHRQHGGAPAQAARAQAKRLRDAAWELAQAARGAAPQAAGAAGRAR